MPAAIYVVLVVTALIITVYMLKKGINVGAVMLIDSVFLVVLAGIPLDAALKSAVEGAVSDKTLKLVLLLLLIMMLENIMRNSGMIRAMVESLKELLGSNRLAAALLPTVIGLLPSPGGARFSCPMVDEMIKENTDGANKAFINYWFRHIWLDGFILYPGAILAAELLGISVISLFLHLVPFIAVTIILGIIFGLMGVKKETITRTRPRLKSLKDFTISMLPVITLITLYISLINFTDYSLELASAVVVTAMLAIKKYDLRKTLRAIKEAFPIRLVVIIIGVMIFKEILFDSGIMDGLPGLIRDYGIPVWVLYLLLPFLGGFSSGITVSYVSITFPILIPLGLGDNLWSAALAFAAGTIGSMITPLHLCASMSADYFKTPIGKLLVRVAAVETLLVFVMVVVMGMAG
ncbi:MAG TPA: DUF401 family protein [Candidatus Nitrosocosmicus sp.]|nr:DUF401 family protein [Candidatus Nitrosocosmicus sp.]